MIWAQLICRGFSVESAGEIAISLHESFYFNGNWKVKKPRWCVFFSACAGFLLERSVWQKPREAEQEGNRGDGVGTAVLPSVIQRLAQKCESVPLSWCFTCWRKQNLNFKYDFLNRQTEIQKLLRVSWKHKPWNKFSLHTYDKIHGKYC